MKNINRKTKLAGALALLALVTSAAFAAQPKQTTVTGSLIPVQLQTVQVRTPSMAFIRTISDHPLVWPVKGKGGCEVEGAVWSDVRSVADGPMPHTRSALIGSNGQRIAIRTDYMGVYHATVPAGHWREARPDVGELPFGVHPTRPRFTCG